MNQEGLQARLDELCKQHSVPGAAVGVFHDGEITEVACGVTNLNTGVETTTDTVFQIGSITKVWTTTLLMQLVDEGQVELDAPVRTYLPSFAVADEDVAAKVTVRHLLTHTSGIDGDHFEDFGRGDDCVERYVDACVNLHQTHPLGATMSYCNTGFSITGRIIEVLTGKIWDEVIRERLFTPLGLTHTSTLPEEAILFRAASGHISPKPGDDPELASVWMLPRIAGPMGLINSTARDVLAFAKMHLDGGKAEDGTQVLSATSVRAMQERQVQVPNPHALGSHWGLGWILFDWGNRHLYGHDGGTIGQSAFLRVAPDSNLAICMLTNGGEPSRVYRTLFTELFAELADIHMPPLPEAPQVPPHLDLSLYAGAYERLNIRYDLAVKDGALAGTVTQSGPLAELLPRPVQNVSLVPVDATTFLATTEGLTAPMPAAFFEFEDGRPRYLHVGARANRRVD